jgi:Nuclease-related domain
MSGEGDKRIDAGTAGASARAEHARRRANRERRVREKHPRVGGLILALQDEPGHEQVWARGAVGEEAVARTLAKYCNDQVVILHDRRISGSRANIDHIAIAPSGVWVIDSKRYKGKVATQKPLFGKPKLTIGGRDKTKLIDGLASQVATVEKVMATVAPGTPLRGVLCFVDADLPMLGNLSFNGYLLLYPKRLAKRLNAYGPLAPERVKAVAAELAQRFPPA